MQKKSYKLLILLLLIIVIIGLSIYTYRYIRVKNAKIEVTLVDNLKINVYSKLKLSDLITKINGKLIRDFHIDTRKIGKKMINFEFINDENIKVKYNFQIEIIDTEPPQIFRGKSFSVIKGYKGNLEDELFCGDNYDDNPKCVIEGNYNYNIAGNYPVTFKATDSSGNISKNVFNLKVKEPSKKPSGPNNNIKPKLVPFESIKNKYKNNTNKIGLDVSKWQGNIDYEKVKEAGVEFVFIRVGSQKGIEGEYVLDPKFKRNIEGFKKVGIPVGIYFYSYANSNEEARKQAQWVINEIKDYDINLPVVFDWECWSLFRYFNKSFFHLTEIADTYLRTLEQEGYEGMLYSSKNYLEKIWYKIDYPIWLAHYTNETNYKGDYKVWQLCSNASIDGINGAVDVNIMY